ncbi:DNA-binding response regulator [Salipaludibacillus agaradhaerens]|jgi:DNA-binding CsgD family transcriptional regulator|uniref:helix-turn-helix transcriptional regulator n=1 Tax=Salipaludibacillus TaxID=1884449 RepID=UPI0020D1DFDE|nr:MULTISPECIES: LuxR C-terminal-related transcriptional regulator [Salipaludibacillus]MCR6116651.1 DNA-binding response regulator [Salipaludibacillus agaradhaerens]UTR13472.1 LuxR C-terminal-related transcriptional regulator [Salipaludibacillus sp. LMS25]
MTKKEIEETLKDYHWMINSIKIIRESMEDAGEGLTAQYGDEAGQPKPQGGTQSDPVYQEVRRREKRWRIVHKYEKKIKVIQSRMHLVKNQREGEVLHWLLEGKSMTWIGKHMGLSDKHISRLRDNITARMSEMSEMSEKMTKEKACV